MTTWLTTFESALRQHLLDLLYAQWHELGVPFAAPLHCPDEVIDPEALLWCSLAMMPADPRLREGVPPGWAAMDSSSSASV
jgi:hypothetical protein